MNPHSQRDVLTLCLRLCLEPVDSNSPETQAVLERYRAAWEAASGGMDLDQAFALLPRTQPNPTAVGKYIDLYRDHCATTPMLNNQECAVIERLAEWAREQPHGPQDAAQPTKEQQELLRIASAASAYGSRPPGFLDAMLTGYHSVQIVFDSAQGAKDHLAALKNAAPQVGPSSQAHTISTTVAESPAELASTPEAGAGVARPINTAPKEFTNVLVWDGKEWWKAHQNEYGDWTSVPTETHQGFYLVDAEKMGFTHWMPLPSAPDERNER